MESSKWSDDDRQWLLDYIESNDTAVLQHLMQEQFSENVQHDEDQKDERAIQLLERIREKIKGSSKPAKLFSLNNWKKVAAASTIILLLATSAYLLYFKKENNPSTKTANTKPPQIDIAPGGNKAILILADGSQIILDSAANGNLANQGNVKVIKLDNGQLAYKGSGSPLGVGGTEVIYNTISTPRGGQYQLTLADGSKVWLNASSSIHFPAAFTGKARQVDITGEAYFEVAKNISMPFKVKINTPLGDGGEVEVMGTHFNINSYSDEPTIKTTLLEGRVKVSAQNGQSSLLMPGQQAQVSEGIKVVSNIDTDEIIAWKAGMFQFTRTDIKTIMRQISRWYNVDVQFEGDFSKKSFSAIVSRSNNISEVLKIMEKAGIQFRIEEKKIIVFQ